jgi:hypothetical protein
MAQENKHSLKQEVFEVKPVWQQKVFEVKPVWQQEVFEVKPVWRNFSISSSGLKAEDWQNGWLIIHPHS